VIAGADVLGGGLGVIARLLQPHRKRLASRMIELVALGHDTGLCLREPHELWIERDRRQAIIGAVAGDHRGRGSRVELGAGLGQVAIEAGLALRDIIVGDRASAERQQGEKRREQSGKRHLAGNSESSGSGAQRRMTMAERW
jgi:hypothetical protein